VQGLALRSMKDPGSAYDDPNLGKDPQVGSMDDYVDTTEDNGGVHTNSGIPNRAFYLAATAMGGNAWDGAGKIWYAALTSGIGADTDFSAFAAATVKAAGAVSAEAEKAVTEAWQGVKVPVGSTVGSGASGE
jgi:Zn-dependent metalloprotease